MGILVLSRLYTWHCYDIPPYSENELLLSLYVVDKVKLQKTATIQGHHIQTKRYIRTTRNAGLCLYWKTFYKYVSEIFNFIDIRIKGLNLHTGIITSNPLLPAGPCPVFTRFVVIGVIWCYLERGACYGLSQEVSFGAL